MSLKREGVVQAALALLNEVGLDGLTVRRLAERLGVQNPALYWHFKNKQELLDEMAKTMVAGAFAGIEPPDIGEDWADWLAKVAGRFRLTLLEHRDGARVIASANLTGSALLGMQEMALNVLIAAGFDLRAALMGIVALFDYTLGAAFEEQTEPASPSASSSHIWGPRYPSPDPARLPLLAAAFDDITTAATDDPDIGFKGGIHLLLAGMAATKKATDL